MEPFVQALTTVMVIHLCPFEYNGSKLYVMPIEDLKAIASALEQEEKKYPRIWKEGLGPHPVGLLVSDAGCKSETGKIPDWKSPHKGPKD